MTALEIATSTKHTGVSNNDGIYRLPALRSFALAPLKPVLDAALKGSPKAKTTASR